MPDAKLGPQRCSLHRYQSRVVIDPISHQALANPTKRLSFFHSHPWASLTWDGAGSC